MTLSISIQNNNMFNNIFPLHTKGLIASGGARLGRFVARAYPKGPNRVGRRAGPKAGSMPEATPTVCVPEACWKFIHASPWL